jgi:hypothetical protein
VPLPCPGTIFQPTTRSGRAALTLAVVAVSCSGHSAPTRHPGPATTASSGPPALTDSAAHFLDAWRRNLTTSWAVTESVARTTSDGRQLDFPVARAQLPPDHVNIGLGTVDARLAGVVVACGVGSTATLACRRQPGALFATTVDNQVGILRSYVDGPAPLYGVAELAGCFQLTLRLPRFPLPPYGRRAVFCFDGVTGAPAGSVVAKDEGTDRTTVTDAHSPATADDLRLPTQSEMQALLKAVQGTGPPTSGPGG